MLVLPLLVSAACPCCYDGSEVVQPGLCTQYNSAPVLNDHCYHTDPNFIGIPCEITADCPESHLCQYASIYGISTCRPSLPHTKPEPAVLPEGSVINVCINDDNCREGTRCVPVGPNGI